MQIPQKKKLQIDQQVDRMVDDGLGAGQVVHQKDEQKIKPEELKKKRNK